MALSNEQIQRLAELEELDALRMQAGKSAASAPAMDPNFGIEPSQPEPGMLKSAAIGAAQGATFDFGDEALAAVQSIMSDKTYRELQRENEAAVNLAAETNPVSYYGGNIASGIAFNPAGKVVGALAKTAMAPVALATKAAPTVARVGQTALEGAAFGGLMGAGQASADDSLVDKVIEGAGTGAAVGTVLGGLTEIGKKALAPFTKRAKEADVFESIRDQVDLTKKGYDPSVNSTFNRVEQEIQDEVKNFVIGEKGVQGTSLPDLRLNLGKELGRVREEAASLMPDFRIKVDPNELSDINTFYIGGETSGPQLDQGLKQYNRLMDSFGLINKETGEMAAREMTAAEAAKMSSEISQILAGNVAGFKIQSPSVRKRLQMVQETVMTPLENQIINSGKYPEFVAARDTFKKIADTQDMLGVEKYYRGDVAAMEADTVKMLNKIKQLANDRTNTGESFRRETRMLREAVNSPGFKSLPKNVQDDLNTVVERLDKFETLSQARAMSLDAQGRTTPDSKGFMLGMNSLRANMIKGIGAALEVPGMARTVSDELITPQGTKALGKVGQSASNVINVDHYFTKLSDVARKNGNTELAKTLNFIGQQDMKKRRALVFVLMQQPGVRSMLKDDDAANTSQGEDFP